MKKTIIYLTLALALTACGEKDASFDTVEQMRTIAKDNSKSNAIIFRSERPDYQGWKVIQNGDSTISPSCPQGDGWASLEYLNPESGKKVKIKCSTYSAGIGCLLAKDFATKDYAKQEGSCNKDVPMPLPKIAQ